MAPSKCEFPHIDINPQVPPDGEFALINYRTTHGFKPPFRLQTTVEADPITDTKALLTLRLWCEVSAGQNYGCDLRLGGPGGDVGADFEGIEYMSMRAWRQSVG